jgi:hypothetical protein
LSWASSDGARERRQRTRGGDRGDPKETPVRDRKGRKALRPLHRQFEDYCRRGLYEPRFIRRRIERDAIRWEALEIAMLKSGMLANEERRDLSPIERSIKEMQESVRQGWINDLSKGRYDEELKAKREIAAREDGNYESMFANQ